MGRRMRMRWSDLMLVLCVAVEGSSWHALCWYPGTGEAYCI